MQIYGNMITPRKTNELIPKMDTEIAMVPNLWESHKDQPTITPRNAVVFNNIQSSL